MNNAPAVNCPVHGTHGALSNGKCWYCVMSGNSAVNTQAPKVRQISKTTTRRVG